MNALFTSRTKRSTAWVVLLVWLFALASGFANACLLDSRGAGHDAFAKAHADGGVVPMVAHARAAAGHDTDSTGAKAACVKVCDDGARSPVTQSSSVDPADPAVALPADVVWPEVIAVGAVHDRFSDRLLAAAALPLRVRYSRLAL